MEEVKDLSHLKLDENKDYFFGIRHAQRDEAKRPETPDIPITDFGIDQAKAAGKVVNELLQRSKVAQVTLIVSPFLRTMQTAYYIAQECGFTEMKIDLNFVESLYGTSFDHNPLDELNSKRMTTKEFQDKFFEQPIDIISPSDEDWKEAYTLFPEEIGEDFHRHSKGFESVMSRHPCEDKTGSNIVILVGHGSMVKSLTDYFEKSDKIVDY
jgi:broad specificity phosphatase PhoE